MFFRNDDEFVLEHTAPRLTLHYRSFSLPVNNIKARQMNLRYKKQQSFVCLVLCLYWAAAMFAREHAVGLCPIQLDDGRYWAYISTQFMVVMQCSVYCVGRRAASFNLALCFPFCRHIHTGHSVMQILLKPTSISEKLCYHMTIMHMSAWNISLIATYYLYRKLHICHIQRI
jgi:hypothetical protein